ncbi:MAG: tRNA 2-thiouridine(34) synthase MnmA [bacterium]
MKHKKEKVIIAMSGGVDSSVTAKLLVDQGYKVAAIFLHFWKEPGGSENKCCSLSALMDARMVCNLLGIKLYTLNFKTEFKKQVVDNFITEYALGRTPNPCVICNRKVKLGLLIQHARKLGFDYVASGHYAQIKKSRGGCTLHQGIDNTKDQSYFLYRLTQDQLSHLMFPLGKYKKTKVRTLAKKFKLPVAEKRESQEICFVSAKSHNDFLKKHLSLKPGKIMDLDNNIIGEHQGLPLYTIGQRKGIEIGGTGPYYAVSMDYKKNILYVSKKKDDPRLYTDNLIIKDIHWINKEPKLPLKCHAVIRYGHKPVNITITKKNSKYEAKLAQKARAITPGQSIVLYKGKQVLGGGFISI